MDINNNIKLILDRRGITQKEIVRLTGIPTSTINNYLKRGTTISAENLKKIATALNVTTDELLSESPIASNGHDVTDNFIMVPVMELKSCAGRGTGYAEFEWKPIGVYPIKKTDVIGYTWGGGELRIIGIEGTSMEPKFHDGDNVLFTTNTDSLRTGDIVIAVWDGRLYIRGYFDEPDGVTLKPLNQIVPPIKISGDDDRLKIEGKVIARVPKLEKECGFYS